MGESFKERHLERLALFNGQAFNRCTNLRDDHAAIGGHCFEHQGHNLFQRFIEGNRREQSNADFTRMLKNTPIGKGIGAKTIEELEKYATKLGVSLYEAMRHAVHDSKTENRDKIPPGAPALQAVKGAPAKGKQPGFFRLAWTRTPVTMLRSGCTKQL